MSNYLVFDGLKKGKMDTTLFLKSLDNHLLIVETYVDIKTFKSINKNMCKKFDDLITIEFEMSMMGEMNFFLELQLGN